MKKLSHIWYNFQYGCTLAVTNMTSQVTCFPTLCMLNTTHIQKNLVNSKTLRPEALFGINPQNKYYQLFSVKHEFWARKRNVSRRRFFYTPKTYVIIDSYSNRSWIGSILWIQCVPNSFRIWEYFGHDQTLLWTCVACAHLQCVNNQYAKFKYTGMTSV